MDHSRAVPAGHVAGVVNYIGEMTQRPRYHANDHSRDILTLDPRRIRIEDARLRGTAPTLGREGFQLVPHRSAVRDFRDAREVTAVHIGEIERLLLEVSGADRVVVNGAGVLRFGEKSPDSGALNNSRPARFVHVDIADATAKAFAARSEPVHEGGGVRRFAHYNVWRVLTPPPQDVPLAICDAHSVAPADLAEADAVFDAPGVPEWSFVGWVLRYNAAHRWAYFSAMNRDEALVFKTNDSDPREPHCVPHSAFDDESCAPDAPPRASLEMRGIAYWFD